MNKSVKKRATEKFIYRTICELLLTILATLGFAYAWYRFVYENNQTGHLLGLGNLGMAFIIYCIIFVILCKWMGAFRIGIERKSKMVASMVLAVFSTNAIEVLVSMAITGQFRFALQFVYIYLILSIIQSIVLGGLLLIMVVLFRKMFPPISMIEIVGEHDNKLTRKMNGIGYKYCISKVLSSKESLDTIKKEIEGCEAVLINDVPANDENKIVKLCFELNRRVYLVPKISDIIIKSSEDLNVVDTPLYLCRNLGINPWQGIIKRFCDIVLCSLSLIVLSPVFLITAIAIKIEDGGPVFFKQERITRGGKRFMILKFRSMIVDAEKDGKPHPAGEKDDRITKVGHIIRACRVDELPQLLNIIKGDMSIVGPRPERWEHVEKYCKEIPEFDFRHKVKGGLTGYAQVYGKYNTTALDKLKLDLTYIANYNLLLDLQIIFETVKILFQKESTEGFDEESIKEIQGQ